MQGDEEQVPKSPRRRTNSTPVRSVLSRLRAVAKESPVSARRHSDHDAASPRTNAFRARALERKSFHGLSDRLRSATLEGLKRRSGGKAADEEDEEEEEEEEVVEVAKGDAEEATAAQQDEDRRTVWSAALAKEFKRVSNAKYRQIALLKLMPFIREDEFEYLKPRHRMNGRRAMLTAWDHLSSELGVLDGPLHWSACVGFMKREEFSLHHVHVQTPRPSLPRTLRADMITFRQCLRRTVTFVAQRLSGPLYVTSALHKLAGVTLACAYDHNSGLRDAVLDALLPPSAQHRLEPGILSLRDTMVQDVERAARRQGLLDGAKPLCHVFSVNWSSVFGDDEVWVTPSVSRWLSMYRCCAKRDSLDDCGDAKDPGPGETGVDPDAPSPRRSRSRTAINDEAVTSFVEEWFLMACRCPHADEPEGVRLRPTAVVGSGRPLRWLSIPGFARIATSLLYLIHDRAPSDWSPNIVTCVAAALACPTLAHPILTLLWRNTNANVASQVTHMCNIVETLLLRLEQTVYFLPPEFPFALFISVIDTLLSMEHFEVLRRSLIMVHNVLDLFFGEHRKRLLFDLLLTKYWTKFFCHWCSDVRDTYAHILVFKTQRPLPQLQLDFLERCSWSEDCDVSAMDTLRTHRDEFHSWVAPEQELDAMCVTALQERRRDVDRLLEDAEANVVHVLPKEMLIYVRYTLPRLKGIETGYARFLREVGTDPVSWQSPRLRFTPFRLQSDNM